jgi:hypothetical protein
MQCDFCQRPFTAAKWWARFCSTKCKDDFHNREKSLARIEAEHDRVRAAERAREDRLNGTITLDLVAVPEPPLVVKRRQITSVEAERR